MSYEHCEVCGSIIRGRPQRITLDGGEITERLECCRECFGATASFLYVDRDGAGMGPVIDPIDPPVVVTVAEDTTSDAENPG